MSQEFLNDPKYHVEGIESVRETIDHFFASNDVKPKHKPKAKAKTPKPIGPKMKVKIPDPPAQTEEEVSAAIQHALHEMDYIRTEYVDFQKGIQDLALYPYIFPDIERFAISCKDMMDMITDNIDINQLTPEGKRDYEHLQKVRARILSSINNKYKKDE